MHSVHVLSITIDTMTMARSLSATQCSISVAMEQMVNCGNSETETQMAKSAGGSMSAQMRLDSANRNTAEKNRR